MVSVAWRTPWNALMEAPALDKIKIAINVNGWVAPKANLVTGGYVNFTLPVLYSTTFSGVMGQHGRGNLREGGTKWITYST